ncbi:ATP-dependent DNA helicase RecG [Canibacter sp. lx-72]|uniref:ATP-dependent DNA helicase RecG n=1 Tax=Canibacter zhuwentaonis TaxID=2837491 RepID=UPI001BDBD76F|nr:ATP-dependent DNA helicase RecG [Canibacter zhuwentaonis]MBT1018188.1 ATP-dependent DNA helicase RecG [Canibacter zhuwentaonis]
METLALETSLHRVLGGATAQALQRAFEYETVKDLLWHLPRRYVRRGELTALCDLPLNEHVTITGQILDVQRREMTRRGGSLLNVRVTDGTGFITLTFFNQAWREGELVSGRQGQFAGKVKTYQGQLQLQNPDYQLFTQEQVSASGVDAQAMQRAEALAFSRVITPVYAATAKIPSWVIASSIKTVLDHLPVQPDKIPAWVRKTAAVCEFDAALRGVHMPQSQSDIKRARASLRFREAFELQLSLVARARNTAAQFTDARKAVSGGYLSAFDAQLPFQLTADQVTVGEKLQTALALNSPMAKLLQGEVGSGKTVVALRAMLQVADNNGQSVLLAPTEVLAGQHLLSVQQLLGDELSCKLRPVLITGSMSAAQLKAALLEVVSGRSKIVIGTHALFNDRVAFYDLGLIVIDEQHRFGVDQRETLRQKGKNPHLLAMTATPIPRTVALTAFGELEVVTLRQLPANRPPIRSFAVHIQENPELNVRAWQKAREEIVAGRQVYVVCPAIEGAEQDDPLSVSGAVKRPRASVYDIEAGLKSRADYAGVRIDVLTGQLETAEKERVMREFAAGEIDLLVATTVVEVGVNVPNATVMIIVEADRFGVSQLHQLRGRIGRGEHASICLLLTEADRTSKAWQRVEAVACTSDGFALAEIDLEQRREGDILGTAQSGAKATLKLLRVLFDGEVIFQARALAEQLLEADPELITAPGLRAELVTVAAKAAGITKT